MITPINKLKNKILIFSFILILLPSLVFSKELQFKVDSTKQANIFFSSENNKFFIYPEVGKESLSYQYIDDSEKKINYSPKGVYALILRTEIGTLWDENGKPKKHHKYYCDLIRVKDGCVIDYFDKDMCYGRWDNLDNLKKENGKTIKINENLSHIANPKEMSNNKYFETDFKYSIYSYMQCYPISKKNVRFYNSIYSLLKIIKKRKKESEYLLKKINSYKN